MSGRTPRKSGPLHIAFDARYIREENHDGISRFSANLAAELAKLVVTRDDIRLTVLVSTDAQRARIPYADDLDTHVISGPTSAREPFVARQVNRINPDIVFSPMQTMGSAGRAYRLVLTIHDLIYYRHPTPPREFSALLRALWRIYHLSWWPQRLLLRGADAIVAVSQTTKALIEKHRLSRRPVYVVPNAAEPLGTGATLSRAKRTPTVVYMGSFMPYKNVETVMLVAEQCPELEFHLMSRVSDADRARLLTLAPHANVIFHNGCSDDEYGDALRSATALISASRDEGFGIPLVEAMAVGTPVVVSDIPIFREIGGTAALYAHPDSPEQFAGALRSLSNTSEWTTRSNASLVQAGTFSWKNSAAVLLDVLVDVARAESQG